MFLRGIYNIGCVPNLNDKTSPPAPATTLSVPLQLQIGGFLWDIILTCGKVFEQSLKSHAMWMLVYLAVLFKMWKCRNIVDQLADNEWSMHLTLYGRSHSRSLFRSSSLAGGILFKNHSIQVTDVLKILQTCPLRCIPTMKILQCSFCDLECTWGQLDFKS